MIGSMSDVNVQALAAICYRLAEFLGGEAPAVRWLKRAAETGDPDIAARAWDEVMKLPEKERRALADWFARVSGAGEGGAAEAERLCRLFRD
jgi:hypothetical protein